jgi:serine protein kinase
MAWVSDFLSNIAGARADLFKESQSILSFENYLKEVAKKPEFHLRDSAQYFNDMIESFGTYQVPTPIKQLKRYRIFDAEYAGGEGRVFGQEQVAFAIIAQIKNFVRAGRVDKLLLLHGPNGSAKTTIVQALAKAAEVYSAQDDGAIYEFSWVFPNKESISGSLGFSKVGMAKSGSYAHLPDDAIDAQISSDQSDHPLLLLSLKERQELFKQIKLDSPSDIKIPAILEMGDLSHKNRQIYDSLLSTYGGNLTEVFRHIRVERFYYSRRYKKGMSVVEPQMSVDAFVRQVTSDQSLQSLPSSLRHLSLFEVMGPLVEANRGLIEYSDLLKRPIDAWKYLLVACEQAQVSAGHLSLFFDLLLIATSNELHMSGFKEYPDWPSFKGRIELIKVPYLLSSKDEEGIYQNQIPKALNGVHIAPHAIAMAARWAVLTRLEPPSVQKYPNSLQEIIRDLSPDEKLDLYDFGDVPLRLSQRQARELRAQIPELAHEYHNEANYEGRHGASPREVRSLILNAAQDSRFDHLSPGAVFGEIELLIEQKSSYEFLRREAIRGYRDAHFLLELVKRHYLRILEDEARTALGLYAKESYEDLFKRYINHVSAWTKKERLVDPLVGRSAEADGAFMNKIEAKFLAANESNEEFRRQLISQIGAYKLENPNLDLDYRLIFSSHLKRLKESVYAEQRDVVERIVAAFLRLMDGDKAGLDEREVNHALALKTGLLGLGYQESSARWAMAYYMKKTLAVDGHKDQQSSFNLG